MTAVNDEFNRLRIRSFPILTVDSWLSLGYYSKLLQQYFRIFTTDEYPAGQKIRY